MAEWTIERVRDVDEHCEAFPRAYTRRAGAIACMVLAAGVCAGQVAGNANYGQNGAKARAEQNERNQRTLTFEELPPTDTSMFLDADVLMNVKADEYVAVFGLDQEGTSAEEAGARMDAQIRQFTDGLKALRVRDSDIFVDTVAQPKVYGYDVAENVAREKLAGIELKKNVAVHYAERDLLNRLMVAAAKAQMYDLIKVDYIVKDQNAVQDRMMTEAAAIIKQKAARDEKLLGIRLSQAAVYAERPAIYYPAQMYDSYTAAESESLTRPANMGRYTVQGARKSRTFYFNGLDGSGFDKVINPVLLEPMVQFTLYLKVKYEVAK